MSDEVLFDAWCGEPIAWARVGQPVIANEWTEHGRRAVTEWLSAAEAVRKYGPVTQIVLGRNGGFKSVTYGDKKFVSRQLDPRGSGPYDDSIVVIDDPVLDNHECPVCRAVPGERCIDERKQLRSSHRKRSQGRTRWEIERAEAEAARQRKASLAAEEWARKMAIAPTIGGGVVEVDNWRDENLERVQADPDRYVVLHTYSNRVIKARAEDGARVFLTRNEHTGAWFRSADSRPPCVCRAGTTSAARDTRRACNYGTTNRGERQTVCR